MQDNWLGRVVTAVGQPKGGVNIVVRAAAGGVPLCITAGEEVDVAL